MRDLTPQQYASLPWPRSCAVAPMPPHSQVRSLLETPTDKRDPTWEKFFEYQLMVDLAMSHAPTDVLDCGAGSGVISAILSAKGKCVRACDIAPEGFRAAGVTCDSADANHALPYPNEAFDLVVSMQTIEHLENPWRFFREIRRVLRPAGVALISTANVLSVASRIQFLHLGDFVGFTSAMRREHLSIIPYWIAEEMCRRAGFAINSVTTNCYYAPRRFSRQWMAWPIITTLGRALVRKKFPTATLRGYSLILECIAAD